MPTSPLGKPPEAGDQPHERRLVAIAFADIAGYSILMAAAEQRTYERWMALLGEVIRPAVQHWRGRLIQISGDGIVVEFTSALDAVEWARDLQSRLRLMPEANPSIVLRIAIHLGEVFVSDGLLFGDAVNLTARLQEHAVPGGIVLSEEVHGLVRGPLGAEIRDLGFLQLKNIAQPRRAYALEVAASRALAPSLPTPGLLPSIAVLPLENMGGDPADDYFSDGIVDDIITSLAGLHELFVISRGSTLPFRGRPRDPREVGRALGVRYALTGSLRRSSRALRIAVQLCDAQSSAILWGDRMEVSPGELFEAQDRIVQQVVRGIAPNVRAAELHRAMRKRPESFTAYDHTLYALHAMESLDRDTFRKARACLDQAMAEDPGFAMPVAWAARWHSLHVGQGWSSDAQADALQGSALAERAIGLDGQNALALATYGHARSFLFHDCDTALGCFDRALAAAPSSALAWTLSSATLSYLGRGEQAVRHAERGMQLSPLDRVRYFQHMFLGIAHYANGSYEEAVRWARLSASENPSYTSTLRVLIVSLAALGRLEEAREAAARLLRLEPGFRIGDYLLTRIPYLEPTLRARCAEHLRKAGLPE